jgi:plasmid stabilization system protein ParE
MATIIRTDTAQNNLIEIRNYISFDSPLQAELLMEGLFTKAQVLEQYPEIGKKLKELPDSEYRELLFKSYRIIYKAYNENVYILSIYHSARLLKTVRFSKIVLKNLVSSRPTRLRAYRFCTNKRQKGRTFFKWVS